MLSKRNRSFLILLLFGLVLPFCSKKSGDPPPPIPTNTFTNPLINGSDPWVVMKDGTYYYTHTLGPRIAIWKTSAMSKLGTATQSEIYRPAPGAANSQNIWAPEIHNLDGKWYVYYTAGAGPDATQRTWVLENGSADPTTGTWTDRGRIYSSDTDFWAIDGTVMEYNGSRYFVWSGRPDPSVQNQNIYIAKMASPWTLQTPSVLISKPELDWEKNGGPVNEAPEFLSRNGKNYIVYSASGCWTDDYTLGLLTLKANGDPLVSTDWTKSPLPVFVKKPNGNVYGPGHNAFFKSPDGTEDWIIYHANSSSGDGCSDRRNIRMQKFTWTTDGTPNFSTPVSTGTAITKPMGD
jgi:GH43 family beta-xylosidase